MATHSSVLVWRIPGTVEPGGLPSMELHRVRHDWSDLAAAAAKEVPMDACRSSLSVTEHSSTCYSGNLERTEIRCTACGGEAVLWTQRIPCGARQLDGSNHMFNSKALVKLGSVCRTEYKADINTREDYLMCWENAVDVKSQMYSIILLLEV